MFEFLNEFSLIKIFIISLLGGILLGVLHFFLKFIIYKFLNSELKINLSFISYRMSDSFVRKVTRHTDVVFYSELIDKKNINFKDAYEINFNEKKRIKIENPLQIQDDELLRDINKPIIFFNPVSKEVYGSFMLVNGGERKTYYRGTLKEIKEIL